MWLENDLFIETTSKHEGGSAMQKLFEANAITVFPAQSGFLISGKAHAIQTFLNLFCVVGAG